MKKLWGQTLFWILIGAIIGLKFADLDQRLPFLEHRSILTHNGLLVLLLFWWTQRQSEPQRTADRLCGIGFCVANAVHLSFDLFPRRWSGPALIHVPAYGETSALFSQVWLFLSVCLCLWLALRAIRSRQELLVGLGCLAGAYWIAGLAEGHIAMEAFVTLLLAVVLVLFATPRRSG